MDLPYQYINNLKQEIDEIPPDSIISRTLSSELGVKTILFGFSPGQELSEHTAAVPAILYFLEGEARLELGKDKKTAQPGTWVQMPPKLPHSIFAETKVIMLLVMLESK
ncbi:MAG: cupin domain-containing protein [Anaerolineales bacterium]|nr:cupin domain-containing protein [Anaerolineales bacterium]